MHHCSGFFHRRWPEYDIGDSLNDISNDITNKDDEDDGDYHIVVQDGVIYMYNTYSGETWRKADKPDSKWAEIENMPNE